MINSLKKVNDHTYSYNQPCITSKRRHTDHALGYHLILVRKFEGGGGGG